MRELIYYTTKNSNLCSIKPIENLFGDRRFLILLVTKLYDVASGSLYVEIRRPNYDVEEIVEKMDKFLAIKKLVKTRDYFELFFYYNEVNLHEDIAHVLCDIWFAFEHCTFCFFKRPNVENFQKKRSWDRITNEQRSYVMFKGIEEDVIWIGKGDDMSFSDLTPPLPFEYRTA